MGLRTTDGKNVSLYDSTEGIAFGPVFESADHAEDFLAWMDRQGLATRPQILYRELNVWTQLHRRWFAERVDQESGELLDGTRPLAYCQDTGCSHYGRELAPDSSCDGQSEDECTCERAEKIDGMHFPAQRHGDCPVHGDRKAVVA